VAPLVNLHTFLLEAPSVTIGACLQLLCSFPALQDLTLRSMGLIGSSPESIDLDLMSNLAPNVPPLRVIRCINVHPADNILYFLVSATAGPAETVTNYNAARRTRRRTLDRLQLEGCHLLPPTRDWLKEKLGDAFVQVQRVEVNLPYPA